ncbi:helix-turn-helix domain-containing protein [Candidatus Daviesbacteria bacterium]|nr:helix-turn-helix domain-containing protein [Candidatus Daviesbacteria bacterium]
MAKMDKIFEPNRFFKRKEICAILRISEATLGKMLKGKIRAVRLPGQYRVLGSEINLFLKSLNH